MPNCPPKTNADRKRWGNLVGKALKDWGTALMSLSMTRKEAREVILSEIKLQTNRTLLLGRCKAEGERKRKP